MERYPLLNMNPMFITKMKMTNGSRYKTEAGKVNFKFAKNANQKNLVRINQGKYKLSIALQKKNKNSEWYYCSEVTK